MRDKDALHLVAEATPENRASSALLGNHSDLRGHFDYYIVVFEIIVGDFE